MKKTKERLSSPEEKKWSKGEKKNKNLKASTKKKIGKQCMYLHIWLFIHRTINNLDVF